MCDGRREERARGQALPVRTWQASDPGHAWLRRASRLDGAACLDLEEVQPRRVHGELERLALAGARIARHARSEETSLAARLAARRLERLRPQGRLHVLPADGRCSDAEMDEDLRAEVLADVDDSGDRARLAPSDDRGVVEILGTDAEDDPLPDEIGRASCRERV